MGALHNTSTLQTANIEKKSESVHLIYICN